MTQTNIEGIRYVAYVRKSSESEDRQISSIEDQKKELKRIAAGLNVVKTFEEERSAKKLGRLEFAKMIALIESGKVQGIVSWKINRLARNPIDGGKIIWLLEQGVLKHIKTDDGDHFPDSDMLLLYIHFGMAHQFSKNLSKDVKRGLKGKAEKGKRPSVAPLGYLNSAYGKKGTEEILIDPERYPILRKMVVGILSGSDSPFSMLAFATKNWGLLTRPTTKHPAGHKLGKSGWYKLLSQTFYYGRYEYPRKSNNWYWGTHTPLMTKAEFDQIQKILGKDHPRPKSRENSQHQ
jgi:DNA invertase Pin-like site-specific DNA recombinase